MVRRGEVWLTVLDPVKGSEIRKTRPCVIVSPAEVHDHLRTAIVAPLTSANKPAPFRTPLKFQTKVGLALLDQIRAIDKSRLVKRLGSLEKPAIRAILGTLQEMFAPDL